MMKFLREHRLLLGIEIVSIFACILACFIPEKLVFSADAEEIADMMAAEGYSDYYYSEEIVLLPGVYRLRVQSGDHEGKLFPTVQSGASTYQALRCNGGVMFAHQREIDLEVYLAGKVDTAFISCNYIGETGQPVEKICLYRTSVGWRLLIVILMVGETGLNMLIWLRGALINHRINKEQETVIWVLGLSILLAYSPYAVDYFSLGADGGFHLLRIEGLAETLMHGRQIPVRIQEYWLYGHGYAVSSFYGDLFLMFPALLRIIGFPIMDAYKFFVLAVLTGTAIIAYHAFFQCTKDRYSALLGSVLYELAPYHIYNIYNRNAVGEYLGMMFMPLVISGIWRIYTWNVQKTDYARAKIPLIVGLSCILQSHILSCEMTVMTLLLVCAVMWKKTFQKEILRELIKTAVWCLLINAWFWVPLLRMLSEDEYVLGEIVSQDIQYMGTRLAGIFQIYPYVGGAQTGMYNCEPIQVGAAFWAVLFCYLVLKIWSRGRNSNLTNQYDKIMQFGVLASLLFLFLSTRYFPWDMLAKVPLVGALATAIQFPTRLLSMTTLFTAFTAAFFGVWLREERKFWCVLGIAAIALWSALYHVNDIAYSNEPIRLYTAENMGTISVVNGEYLLDGMNIQEMGYHDPVADEGLLLKAYTKEGLTISLEVSNTTQNELYMELPITGYHGYGIDAEPGEEEPYITEERGSHGDLRIAVPAGYTGDIEISYKGFLMFRIAERVSGITILYWLGSCIWKRSVRRKETIHE